MWGFSLTPPGCVHLKSKVEDPKMAMSNIYFFGGSSELWEHQVVQKSRYIWWCCTQTWFIGLAHWFLYGTSMVCMFSPSCLDVSDFPFISTGFWSNPLAMASWIQSEKVPIRNHHNKSDFVPIELGIPEKSILVAVGYLSKHPIPIVKPMEDTSSFCLSDHHTFWCITPINFRCLNIPLWFIPIVGSTLIFHALKSHIFPWLHPQFSSFFMVKSPFSMMKSTILQSTTSPEIRSALSSQEPPAPPPPPWLPSPSRAATPWRWPRPRWWQRSGCGRRGRPRQWLGPRFSVVFFGQENLK